MKFLALTLAVVAPLGAAAANAPREGGGAIRGAGAPPRALLAADEDDLMATCFALGDNDACVAHGDCSWCKSGAVPSACYPTVKASALPAGVFECAAAAVIADVVLPPAAPKRAAQAFSLAAGLTHTLDQSQVDGGFCDASSPLSLAGYMNVKGSQFDNKDDKNLFYWFFEKRTTSQLPTGKPQLKAGNEETPLIVWLTGGPGCSSSLALLSENGPCSPTADGAASQVNQYSWTESAHVLWLDQPADVGYSYGQGNDSNEEMISEDAYYFLQAFFKSEEGAKYKDAPLHIVGESYGGHYAPAIAHRILRGNNDLKEKPNPNLDTLNLKGLAVGNGLTDPETQYKYYAEMAYDKAKVIDKATYDKMNEATTKCTDKIAECNKDDDDSFACQSAFLTCNIALTSPYRATGMNPYDYSKKCGSEPLCYDFSSVETFMNSDATKEALHVKDRNPTWQTCNMEVNGNFHVDWMKNFAPKVADLLDAGVPALIYAGDLDFVCNYLGNRAWTLNLDWKHKAEFNAAEEHDWNNQAGLARTANGLTFLQVYDAGHMVPSDQPAHALDMITQHLSGRAF